MCDSRIVAVVAFLIGTVMFAGTSQAQQTPLFAVLSGGYEVPRADPNGGGSATVHFPNSTTLCYAVIVSGIGSPTAMHIHRALAGTNGAVEVILTPPPAGNPGSISGCVAITTTQFSAIRANPSRFYINVHNAEYPGGAVRGQLF